MATSPCLLCLIVVNLLALCNLCHGINTVPTNEYEFALERDRIVAEENEFQNNRIVLSEDETIVNHYLNYLKWVEFDATKDAFPPARPIEEQLEHILNSEVFEVLKNMPKGGSIHGHGTPLIPVKELLRIGFESEDFEFMYMKSPNASEWAWSIEYSLHPLGEDWVRLADNPEYTIEVIEPHHTLIGTLTDEATDYPQDSATRWKLVNFLWGMNGATMSNAKLYSQCYRAMMQWNFNEGILYVEHRDGLPNGMFILDPTSEDPRGHREFDKDGEIQVNMTLEVIDQFKSENPSFIGMAHIVAEQRSLGDVDAIKTTMLKALEWHERYPWYFIGFDLQQEEDIGASHMFYLEAFMHLKNQEDSELPLYMHTAETSWLDDLLTSENDLDPVSTIQNAYEAILLGARRVGHGLGYIKHPFLLNLLKERDVAIEICPVSHQILGQISDLRNHPAINYIRAGLQLVLGPDDPGTFGEEYFTVDWYEAFMAWGLDLRHLKMLAENSLKYSGIPTAEKEAAIEGKWRPLWDEYIVNMRTEACAAELNLVEPIFSRILPRVGPADVPVNVHVFGRHFERAVCQPVRCMFGTILSPSAQYKTNQHIVCEAPVLPEAIRNHLASPIPVAVFVELEGDGNFIDTGETFTYHPSIVPPA